MQGKEGSVHECEGVLSVKRQERESFKKISRKKMKGTGQPDAKDQEREGKARIECARKKIVKVEKKKEPMEERELNECWKRKSVVREEKNAIARKRGETLSGSCKGEVTLQQKCTEKGLSTEGSFYSPKGKLLISGKGEERARHEVHGGAASVLQEVFHPNKRNCPTQGGGNTIKLHKALHKMVWGRRGGIFMCCDAKRKSSIPSAKGGRLKGCKDWLNLQKEGVASEGHCTTKKKDMISVKGKGKKSGT